MHSNIEKALTLSTAHITEKTARWLDSKPKELIIYPKRDYGWFISVGELEEEDLRNVPSDILFLIGCATGTDCSWLQLDRDAAIVDSLPTFDW